jgi:hypothetical protein
MDDVGAYPSRRFHRFEKLLVVFGSIRVNLVYVPPQLLKENPGLNQKDLIGSDPV